MIGYQTNSPALDLEDAVLSHLALPSTHIHTSVPLSEGRWSWAEVSLSVKEHSVVFPSLLPSYGRTLASEVKKKDEAVRREESHASNFKGSHVMMKYLIL